MEGSQAGETWQDSTYYNYCLPINDSCSFYKLELLDNVCNGWNSSLPAATLITSASGDTLLYFEAGGVWWCSKYLTFNSPTGCTDPIASNYDAMAVCDDGSCCYSTSSVLQIFTNAQNGHSQNMGWQLRDANGYTG